MKKDTLVMLISVLIITTHIAALVFAFAYIGLHLKSDRLAQDLCAILAPMTGAFLILIVQNAADRMNDQPDTGRVNPISAWLFISMTLIFAISIAAALSLTINQQISPSYVKGAIALVETGMGAYLSIFIKKLFSS